MTVPLELNTEQIRGEKRVVFNHLSWLSYQQILQAVGENNRAHLFYDRGTLEITMTLEEHEFYRELIGLFIRILVVELGLKIKSMGSTTLAREDLERGAEPDNAYYIQNQAKVLGKRINLTEDPPPDLVVEVDITHTHQSEPHSYLNQIVIYNINYYHLMGHTKHHYTKKYILKVTMLALISKVMADMALDQIFMFFSTRMKKTAFDFQRKQMPHPW